MVILLAACARSTPVLPGPTAVLNPTGSETAATWTVVPGLTPTNTPDPSATPAPISTRASTPTPAPSFDHYQIDARFDYSAHHLSVTEVVSFTNRETEAYSDLAFQVEPNDHPGDIVLTSITLPEDQPAPSYKLEGNRLSIPLPSPLGPGQSSQVTLVYDLSLPSIPPPSNSVRPTIFGYTTVQANLVDWFPFLPPYQPGKGWVIHNPWYYGEHQVYPIADYDVNLTLLNPPKGLVIAASSVGQSENDIIHYHLEQARTFVFSASPLYQVISQVVNGVQISSYAFPIDNRANQEALHTTVNAVALYSQLFGPYQHSSLTVVEGDFLDGMEYDGLFFLSRGFYNLYDGTPKGYLTDIAAHETAHQWWFGQVGNDQAMEPWLDEALATYTEKIYYEHYYPNLVSWWWDYRVNYYHPSGWVNQPIYSFNGFEAYRNAVYLNGATFLDQLRVEIGDDAFFAFLKDYASKEKDTIVTSQTFFDLLAKHSSKDISSLKAKFFK